RGSGPGMACSGDPSVALVLPVVGSELDVVEPGLRGGHRDEDRVLLAGRTKRPHSLRWDAHRRPGCDVDDFTVELPLGLSGDEEVDLLLKGVTMAAPVGVTFRGAPAAAEAFIGHGEILQPEWLAHETDLEVIRIHAHRGSRVGNVGYR